MIAVIRAATAFPRVTGEAVPWAREIAASVKRVTGIEHGPRDVTAEMLADVVWIGRYDSVGDYDDSRTNVITDRQYIDALHKGRVCQ